jgi:hypothetical protein
MIMRDVIWDAVLTSVRLLIRALPDYSLSLASPASVVGFGLHAGVPGGCTEAAAVRNASADPSN